MSIAKITVHPAFPIGEISDRLYGAFLEPIGSMVYGTMYNPGHPTADEQGFRQDYIEALKGKIPAVRLPGGNFVSGWRWKDMIGPMNERKKHVDLAWFQDIPVEVGHDEYLQWMEKIQSEPLYTINLGTESFEDAIDIVEYTNLEGGTYWSDLRRKYGHEKPYDVKVWYLGNEVDGPWQIGSYDRHPKEYGFKANEISKVLKWTDPTIETAACVSCTPYLYHYPKWDIEALEECYEAVDYISMHHYHFAPPDDLGALLGGTTYFDDYIRTEIGICDYVQTLMRSPRKMMLSVDEYMMAGKPNSPLNPGGGLHNQYSANYRFDPSRKFRINTPNHIEERGGGGFFGSHIVNALCGSGLLISFMNHADRVKIACMTSGISAIAQINNEGVWKSVAYYPYTMLMRYGRGVAMQTSVSCDTYDIPGFASDDNSVNYRQEGVPFVIASSALNEKAGELTVFVINRNADANESLELDVSGFEGYKFLEHIELYSDDLYKQNTIEDPEAVVPKKNEKTTCENGKVKSQLHSISFNMFRFGK